MKKVDGHAIGDDDMNWSVECPECSNEIEYEGYFEASDLNRCKCGCYFLTRWIYFEDGSYIE